jgi:hypothetical protein
MREELYVLGFNAVESKRRKEINRRKLAEAAAASNTVSRKAARPIRGCEILPSDVASINAGQMSGARSSCCHEPSFKLHNYVSYENKTRHHIENLYFGGSTRFCYETFLLY